VPSTRRRRTRGSATLTLRQLGILGQLDFLVGWRPPTCEIERLQSPRWRSFRDYLADYAAVRDEMIARHPPRPEDFAEALCQRVAATPRADVEVLGAAVYAEKYPDFTMWRTPCPQPDDDSDAGA
jgi:hypothetical protein